MARWDRLASRGRVEDRRGMAPVVGGISLTGVAILLLFNVLTGGDISDVLYQLDDLPVQTQTIDTTVFEGEDNYEVFTSTVLGSNNDLWKNYFNQINKNYTEPTLVLFRQATNSACSGADSRMGPHYCPLDQTIYLDETFFEELTGRYGARGGDVAQAYVIAHEVGHHAQNQLGILERSQKSKEESISLELQADCFAGLWANSIKDLGVFEPGEIEEAMDAAAAVGDDRIQKEVSGDINPETWTHGSSAQRMEAFNLGFESGSFSQCSF